MRAGCFHRPADGRRRREPRGLGGRRHRGDARNPHRAAGRHEGTAAAVGHRHRRQGRPRHSRPRGPQRGERRHGAHRRRDRGSRGPVRAAVIDFGGFLGVGSRKIVVDWGALHFGGVANKRDSITLELTKAQVAAAPEYKEDSPVIVLGAAGRLQPWDFDQVREKRSGRASRPSLSDRSARRSPRGDPAAAAMSCRCRRPASSRNRRAKASAASTGSSSFSPTCRPASVRSSRSI